MSVRAYGLDAGSGIVLGPTQPTLLQAGYDTFADLADAAVSPLADIVQTLGYHAPGDGGGAKYRRAAEPAHPGKVRSADGAWWEIAEATLDAKHFGCRCDHDGTMAGGADDTEAFRAFIAAIAATRRPGTWAGGIRISGATLTANGPITVPPLGENVDFTLRGVSPRGSYLYLDGEFDDFFLQFEDRLGLWAADTAVQYIDGESRPPPATFRKLYLGDFSVFGRGSDDTGAPVSHQKGISLNGRHDTVLIEHVYMFNIDGCALHCGRSVAGEKNGFRESSINHLVIYRCGSTTEAAWILDGGEDASFGPNWLYLSNCECSVSRGDGLYIRCTNPNNSSHSLYFSGLKLHGTGTDGSHPLPWSKRGLVIEGVVTNAIQFRGMRCTQYATHAGEHMVELIRGVGRLAIDQSLGTNIGDMTLGGGLAAAFDGNRDQTEAASAGKDAATSAWIGKTLSPPSTIARGLVWGSTDEQFIVGSDPQVTFRLYAKNGAAPTGPTDGATLLGTSVAATDPYSPTRGSYRVINSSDVTTVWDHVLVSLEVTAPANIRTSDVTFFQAVPAWPTHVQIDMSMASGDGGVKVEGGGNHNINIWDTGGAIVNNHVTLGADVMLPVVISLPKASEEFRIGADANVGHLAHMVEAPTCENLAWTKHISRITSEALVNNSTTGTALPHLSIDVEALASYYFLFRMYYGTTAAADAKYSIVTTNPLTAIAITKRTRAPGTAATTVTTAAAMPTNEVVAGGTGHGTIEVEGTFTCGAVADSLTFRFAQSVLDAGPTVAKVGAFYVARKLA